MVYQSIPYIVAVVVFLQMLEVFFSQGQLDRVGQIIRYDSQGQRLGRVLLRNVCATSAQSERTIMLSNAPLCFA